MRSPGSPLFISRRQLLLKAGAAAVVATGAARYRGARASAWDVYATTTWDDIVELRVSPLEGARVVSTLSPGTTVRLLDGPVDGGLYRVEPVDVPDARPGWLPGWLLVFEQRALLSADVPLLYAPDDWSAEAGWVRHGFLVTMISPVYGDWVVIRSGDNTGFVSVWNLSPAEGPETDRYAEWWVSVNRSTAEVRLWVGEQVVDLFQASLSSDQGEGFYATATGTHWVYQKIAELTYTEFARAYFMYWAGFDPDRYNGFHSWTMDAYGNVVDGGWGTTAGCVATAPAEALTIYNFVDIGTRVEVHW